MNNNINRTLIIGFSICGKFFLMIKFLFQKQEKNFIIRKSLNPFPKIKAQISDEIQAKESF